MLLTDGDDAADAPFAVFEIGIVASFLHYDQAGKLPAIEIEDIAGGVVRAVFTGHHVEAVAAAIRGIPLDVGASAGVGRSRGAGVDRDADERRVHGFVGSYIEPSAGCFDGQTVMVGVDSDVFGDDDSADDRRKADDETDEDQGRDDAAPTAAGCLHGGLPADDTRTGRQEFTGI